jgi:hypothetical protein
MAEFRLPRLPEKEEIVEATRRPTFKFQRWWQSVVKKLEETIAAIQDTIDAVVAAQAAADAAQTAADNANTAAAAAQTAANDAQAAVDAIVVPPVTSRSTSANTATTPDDYTILADASGGAITVTLHSAASALGPIRIIKTDATGNAVNVDVTGTDTINGGAIPIAITLQNTPRDFTSDGTSAWYG